jgi:uncharacterized protein (TIGR02145 family)
MSIFKSLIVGAFAISVCIAQSDSKKVLVKDADGNIYTTVKIGDQLWAGENLRTTKYNDSSEIPMVTDKNEWQMLRTPAFCWYGDDSANKNIYGGLYNWYAVNSTKLAPRGWHVANAVDWGILESYLRKNGYNWDRSKGKDSLFRTIIAKSLATRTSWQTSIQVGAIGNNMNKNNLSGFSALPGGYRDSIGNYAQIGYHSYLWAANEFDSRRAYYRCLLYDNMAFIPNNEGDKRCGFSVRLVQDNYGEEYKSNCRSVQIADLTQNANRYRGKMVSLTGEFLLCETTDDTTSIILSIKDTTNTMHSGLLPLLVINPQGGAFAYSRYINKIVTVYGKVYGDYETDIEQVKKRKLPRVDAKYIELMK